jgi:hypothetical protein
MTCISIKLPALAVFCGCASLLFYVALGGKKLVGLFVLSVTGIWFVGY